RQPDGLNGWSIAACFVRSVARHGRRRWALLVRHAAMVLARSTEDLAELRREGLRTKEPTGVLTAGKLDGRFTELRRQRRGSSVWWAFRRGLSAREHNTRRRCRQRRYVDSVAANGR